MKPARLNNKKKYKFSKSSKPFNFLNFGNIFYYPGFSPDFFYFKSLLSSYEMSAPNLAYLNKAHEIGNQARNELSKIPGIGTEQSEKDTFLSEQITQILQILKIAIENERNNEIKFINNKIALLKNNFDPSYIEKNKDLATIELLLKKMGDGEGINYPAFISLINVIQNGVRNTESIFQFEKEHLEKLEAARIANEKALENQIRGLGVSRHKDKATIEQMIESAKKNREARRIDYYLEHHNIGNLQGFKRYMKNMEAVNNKIANWIMATARDQLQKNYSFYESIIRQKNLLDSHKSMSETIKELLIQDIILESKKFVPEILSSVKNNFNTDLLEQDLINNFGQKLNIRIEGIPDSLGISKKKLKIFQDRITQNNADTRSAEDLYNTLSEIIKELRKKDPNNYTPEEQIFMNNLDSFFINEIEPIEQEMNKIRKIISLMEKNKNTAIEFSREDNQRTGSLLLTVTTKKGKNSTEVSQENLGQDFKTLGLSIYQSKRGDLPKSLESVVNTLKKAASARIKDKIIDILLNQPNNTIKTGIEDSLRDICQRIQVKVKGDTLEELFQGLDNTTTVKILTGGTHVKNDFQEIVIGFPNGEQATERIVSILTGELNNLNNNDNKQIISEYQDVLKQYQSQMSETIQENIKEIQSNKQWTNYEKMSEQYFKSQQIKTESMQKILDLFEQAQHEIELKTKDADEKNKKLEELKKMTNLFLDSLKNSIYESSTMKTFRTYQNDIGFVGGSIGSTVESQIQTFNDLFSAAGMPIDKEMQEWLKMAIINCSPLSVVGNKNKDFIEDWLGGLATFALFNEGSAELLLLRKQLEGMQTDTSNDIMHLYKLNSIYYPGSFVLKQVVKNLEAITNTITQAETTISKKNIMIYNPASENMIPNRGNKKKGIVRTANDTNPWQTVGKKVSSKTEIKILFLAGLLDIVKELHNQMNIELPQ